MSPSTWLEDTLQRLHAEERYGLERRLARLPERVARGDYEAVDLEAAALGQALEDSPWASFFARYLGLYSRIVDRLQITETEAALEALVEEAGGEGLAGCPQAVLTVPLLAAWHAGRDRLRSAEDRLALTEAALSKLSPGQLGYDALVEARVRALLDSGEAEAACALCEEHGPARFAEFEARMASGDTVEAAQRLSSITPTRPLELLQLAIGRARLGREAQALAQAVELLPPYTAILPFPALYLMWAQLCASLAGVGALENAPELDQQLRTLQDYLEAQGGLRDAADLGLLRFDLAQARGRPAAMKRIYTRIDRIWRAMPAPEAEARTRRRMERRLERAAKRHPPKLDPAPGPLDPEEAEGTLAALSDRWPEAPELALQFFSLAEAFGDGTVFSELYDFVLAFPDAPGTAIFACEALSKAGDLAQLEPLVAAISAPGSDPELALFARVSLAQAAAQAGDAARALQEAEAILRDAPKARVARAVRFAALSKQDPEAVLSALGELDDPTEPEAWLRLQLALQLGQGVVDAAEAFGDSLDDPPGERIHVFFEGEAGPLLAARTGPVSCVVLELSEPGLPQHFGDRLAIPGAPSRIAFEREAYRALGVIAAGGFSAYELEARYDEAGAAALNARLSELGVELLSDARGETPAAGARTRWRLGLPAGVGLDTVCEALEEYPAELACPELLLAAGWRG